MNDRSEMRNKFEFVAVASARARQLLRGCTPRVAELSGKKARVAMQEVQAGEVGKEPAAAAPEAVKS